jgi:FkbM family methyltransferase
MRQPADKRGKQVTESEITNVIYQEISGRYGRMNFLANDSVIGSSLRLYGEWAELELQFCKNFIKDGDVVLDIGAYIGTHALAFSNFVGPEGQVHSFEPQRISFQILKQNLAQNHLSHAMAHHAAIGAQCDRIDLLPLNVEAAHNFGSYALASSEVTAASSQAEAVDVISIDSLNLERCDFIKIDVEGLEHQVVKGGEKTIKRFEPIIYGECNSVQNGHLLIKNLIKLDYRCFAHVVDAFNPENFNSETANLFGRARELAILALPARLAHLAHRFTSSHDAIYDIETLDDVVFAMLQKPQYGAEVLKVSAAAKIPGIIVQQEDLDNALQNSEAKILTLQRELAETQLRHSAKSDLLIHAINERNHLVLKQNKLQTHIKDLDTRAEEHRIVSGQTISGLTDKLNATTAKLNDRESEISSKCREINEAIVELSQLTGVTDLDMRGVSSGQLLIHCQNLADRMKQQERLIKRGDDEVSFLNGYIELLNHQIRKMRNDADRFQNNSAIAFAISQEEKQKSGLSNLLAIRCSMRAGIKKIMA